MRETSGLLILAALWPLFPANPVVEAEDFVRRGNAAFARGDYLTAVEYYQRAEERITDPGLTAFNQAICLYQLGRYREAELFFRRALEDAEGERRARALYGLGNCLVQQSTARTLLLRSAVASYEQCLQVTQAPADLLEDVRYNLELARLLLRQSRSSDSKQNEPDAEENRDPDKEGRDALEQGGEGRDRIGRGRLLAGQRPGSMEGPSTTDAPPPGQGNLPPVPDEDALQPLSSEDAREHIRQASTRIQKERTTSRQQFAPPVRAEVKDW